MKNYYKILFILMLTSIFSCSNNKSNTFDIDNLYPWCIVAYDSLQRSPTERIEMLNKLEFNKYAYDWRDKNLVEMEQELTLATENNIEIISVWIWLNAKRDSIGKLSPSNNQIFEKIKNLNLKTTIWLSFSDNFFKNKSQEESMQFAIKMVEVVSSKAKEIDCKVALYNHKGWFGNPYNEIEIIKSLPQYNLSMVYNFHHAHDYLNDFPIVAKTITPYLSAVNLNGMRKEGPKILQIGLGNHEKDMINILLKEGFKGPWGILGHIANKDVKEVLENNIKGLNSLDLIKTK